MANAIERHDVTYMQLGKVCDQYSDAAAQLLRVSALPMRCTHCKRCINKPLRSTRRCAPPLTWAQGQEVCQELHAPRSHGCSLPRNCLVAILSSLPVQFFWGQDATGGSPLTSLRKEHRALVVSSSPQPSVAGI